MKAIAFLPSPQITTNVYNDGKKSSVIGRRQHMNLKKWLLASIVVFIIMGAFDTLFNTVCLSNYYEMTASLWRPEADMKSKIWMFYVAYLIWAFLFCYIYTKGYEGKGSGAAEGLRYGFILGLFVNIMMAIGMYGSMPIPGRLAIYWFIMGMFIYLLSGLALGLIYKKA